MPPFHLTPEQWKLLEYLAWGATSGLIGAMTKARRLHLPRILVEKTKSGETVKVIDTGFLAAPLLGALLAAVVDGRPWTACAYGLASGFAGPAILNLVADAVLKKIGLDTAANDIVATHPKGA